ncbi:MAG TPA: peptidoglycan DD-metalloendopeptidase family protein [Bacilli bacterium]|nr:peptidoglycan DD-metalloendopeptidase family protein [Bacilli bacterium]
MQVRKSSFSSKKLTIGLSAAVALVLLWPQTSVFADINSLREQQARKQEELNKTKEKIEEARDKKAQFQAQIDLNAAAINELNAEINERENKIAELQGQIFQKTQDIAKTERELEAAQKRIEERNDLIKKRMVLMYEKGDVQYLEVLLDSTSFTDFLERFETLQLVVEKDTEILERNKQEHAQVEKTKIELEKQKDSLVSMQTEELNAKTKLDGLLAQKEEINRRLEANKEEQEAIEAQQQAIQQQAIDAIYQLEQQIEAERRKNNTQQQAFSGPFTWPLPSSWTITSEFGERIDPFTGQRAGHNGMDIAAPQGTEIVAAQSGTVITSGWVSGFGNCIIINHGDGLWTLYGHIMNGGLLVSVGQEVTKGQAIAKVGTTGRSTGPHLHFGCYLDGQLVNPRNYL